MASSQHVRQQYDSMSSNSQTMPSKHSSNPLDDKSSTYPSIMRPDSLVTVRLSEPSPHSLTSGFGPDSVPPPERSLALGDITLREYAPRDAMTEDLAGADDDEGDTETIGGDDFGQRNLHDAFREPVVVVDDSELEDTNTVHPQNPDTTREAYDSDPEEINWAQLQKKEDEQSRRPATDNSTAMLLVRLEKESKKLATNQKVVKAQPQARRSIRKSRPPSMAQIRQMVTGPTPQAIRYSILPPPPMTDLEFYAALVKDYDQTVARLPTLVSKKIRKGVPPPLRGVVWQSMSASRDAGLEDLYDQLCGENSPFEGTIGKDLGRTFPGVEMFRDPEGDGQRMLGRVLKCFSLYDPKIGYCQGLAFIVGPLLMHMPDRQAFCVLVKLMERYDIRNSYVQGMPGLCVRIYQFGELLKRTLPTLSSHLHHLHVEPVYVSQWFLSFFAVTCPLPMLFRIYDLVFAEGASETIMRVALSLMRKNQTRILACTEFEDAMQLLLSRSMWDCYHYNADEFVDDFVELSNVAAGKTLSALEEQYQQERETSGQPTPANAANLAFDITSAPSRFLGRLWTGAGNTFPKAPATIDTALRSSASTSYAINAANNLSPRLAAPPRPVSMVKRSTSKNSLASTLNSMETSSASVLSTVSTDATSVSRDSSNTDDSSTIAAATDSIKQSAPAVAVDTTTTTATAASTTLGNATVASNSASSETKYLNNQIEELLTALSELQRTHALVSTDLQQEREDREEDKKAVKSLLGGFRSAQTPGVNSADEHLPDSSSPQQFAHLIVALEQRFGLEVQSEDAFINERPLKGPPQTPSQLREDLERTRRRLEEEESRGEESKRRILDLQTDVITLKDQLKESRDHARVLHADKQRLERQIHSMRVRASTDTRAGGDQANRQSKVAGAAASGLREFKLGRSKSTASQAGQINKRTSSMQRNVDDSSSVTVVAVPAPANEREALLLELAQAKTAEAIAKQEAEEAKIKIEQLRRQHELSSYEDANGSSHVQATTPSAASAASAAASNAANAAMGVFGRLTGSTAATDLSNQTPTLALSAKPTGTASSGGGGFWGWRR